MYTRLLHHAVQEKFFSGKVIIITGARQTGKTTLALSVIKRFQQAETCRIFNCDNPTDRQLLTEKDLEFLKQLVGEARIIFIDEGQKVPNIGQTIKLLVDFYQKEKQIIVTGSSSMNLLDQTQEALTGRKFVHTLFPLSMEELYPEKNLLNISKEMENLLIFGAYPEVATQTSIEAKIERLKELHTSSFYKELLEFQQIRNSDTVMKLVKALALQIGSEVSYSELSTLIGIDQKTVERYLDLLEKSFILFRLSPYAKNKRREISKLKKVYFYDLGIRNAIINNFNFLDSRNDQGALWENFVMVERLKFRSYHRLYGDSYFWRTYDGSEVDLVEERDGKLYGYECKWSAAKHPSRKPLKWLEYPQSSYQVITPKNLVGFVL